MVAPIKVSVRKEIKTIHLDNPYSSLAFDKLVNDMIFKGWEYLESQLFANIGEYHIRFWRYEK
jgi:hypothetical protein